MWKLPHEKVICCDRKASAFNFSKANCSDKLLHWFSDAESSLENSGHCYLHNQVCSVAPQPCDLLVFGSPCAPFSDQRATQATQPPQAHPLFKLTFGMDGTGSALEHVARHCPKLFVGEQVMGFSRPDLQHVDERPYLHQFVDRLRSVQDQAGRAIYSDSVKVVRLQGSLWAEGLERDRCPFTPAAAPVVRTPVQPVVHLVCSTIQQTKQAPRLCMY